MKPLSLSLSQCWDIMATCEREALSDEGARFIFSPMLIDKDPGLGASRVSWESISDAGMIRDAFDVGWGRQLKGHVSAAAASIPMRQELFPPLKIAALASQIFSLWE